MAREIGRFLYQGEELVIYTSTYKWNGRLAIIVETTDAEPYSTLSINVEEVELGPDEFVLNHDLLSPIHLSFFAALGQAELFVDTSKMCNYGFCKNIPIWKLK